MGHSVGRVVSWTLRSRGLSNCINLALPASPTALISRVSRAHLPGSRYRSNWIDLAPSATATALISRWSCTGSARGRRGIARSVCAIGLISRQLLAPPSSTPSLTRSSLPRVRLCSYYMLLLLVSVCSYGMLVLHARYAATLLSVYAITVHAPTLFLSAATTLAYYSLCMPLHFFL
eukprot:1093788-Rhodomonas_salina.2